MPVASVVERGGKVPSLVTVDVTAANVGRILAENISSDTRLMTDGAPIYMKSQTKPLARQRYAAHSKDQYAVRDGPHSNIVESACSLLKHSLCGTFPQSAASIIARSRNWIS